MVRVEVADDRELPRLGRELGRDGGSVADWTDVRREAADAHNDRTAAYLLGMPLLADFIEEGLNILGVSVEEFEMGRL